MDLIELYKDQQFKIGDRVYHKTKGAVGKIVYYNKLNGKIELDMIGFTHLQGTLKNRLTHKIPLLAYPKHIYKYCPRFILAAIFTWGVISLVTISVLGNPRLSILAFVSVMPIVAGIVFDSVQKGYLKNVNLMLSYGLYETALFLISIYDYMNKAA